jgi:hypothetical protein
VATDGAKVVQNIIMTFIKNFLKNVVALQFGGKPMSMTRPIPRRAGRLVTTTDEYTKNSIYRINEVSSEYDTYDDEELQDSLYEQRMPRAHFRYNRHTTAHRITTPRITAPTTNRALVPAQAYQQELIELEDEEEVAPAQPSKRRRSLLGALWHMCITRPKVMLVVGMSTMFLLWFLTFQVIAPWVQSQVNHWQTGDARIARYRIDVGHAGVSEFVTQYYRGQVVIIEFVGGDTKNTRLYTLPVSLGNDNTPHLVTLQTRQINPEGKSDKPDLLIIIEGNPGTTPLLYNNGTAFQLDKPQVVK